MRAGGAPRPRCCVSDQCPRTDWRKILTGSSYKVSTSIWRFGLQDKGWFPIHQPSRCLLFLGSDWYVSLPCWPIPDVACARGPEGDKRKRDAHFRKRFKQDKIFSFSRNYLRISSLTALSVRDGTQDVAYTKPEVWPCCNTVPSASTIGCCLGLGLKLCWLTPT